MQTSYAVSSSEYVDVILGEEASREGYGAVVDGVGIYLFALETQEGVVKACFWMQQGESALEQQENNMLQSWAPTRLRHDFKQRSSSYKVIGGVELSSAAREHTRSEPVEQAREVGREVRYANCRRCKRGKVDGLDVVEERGLARLECTEGTSCNEAAERVADDAELGHTLGLYLVNESVNLLQYAYAARVDAVVGEVALVGFCAEHAQLVAQRGLLLLICSLDGLDDALDVSHAAPETAGSVLH